VTDARKKRILLVDDDPDEAALTILQFREAGWDHDFTLAHDGEEAIALLKAGCAGSAPLPDLVILDLNMPRATGYDVLEWMRDALADCPVPAVVMSNSGRDVDRTKSLALGARAYFTKPSELAQAEEMMRQLKEILGP
jgi:CheY-like chemotaxis protein